MLLAPVLLVSSSASASIIEDKSDFVGDFTVIDFETWGDDTPLVLDEGDFIELAGDEYADLGVTITSSINIWGNECAHVGSGTENAQADAAHAQAGSPANVMFGSGSYRYVRLDFPIPVNAVGVSVMNWTDGDPVRKKFYNTDNTPIESLAFDDADFDGTDSAWSTAIPSTPTTGSSGSLHQTTGYLTRFYRGPYYVRRLAL